MYWPSQNTLLVADVHLGKEQAFTRAGNPIPAGPTEADITRLAKLVKACGASRLLILGDLIHAKPTQSEGWLLTLSHFLDAHTSLSVEVVAGNHDKAEGQTLLDNRIRWYADPLIEAPFVFQHEPGIDTRGHVLCGHVHPCYRLSVSRKESVRAPVFWLGKQCSIMPSFGQFTGGHTVKPSTGDQLFMFGPDCVIPVFGHKQTLKETIST